MTLTPKNWQEWIFYCHSTNRNISQFFAIDFLPFRTIQQLPNMRILCGFQVWQLALGGAGTPFQEKPPHSSRPGQFWWLGRWGPWPVLMVGWESLGNLTSSDGCRNGKLGHPYFAWTLDLQSSLTGVKVKEAFMETMALLLAQANKKMSYFI